ncbi:MAG: replicative DNA helicase [Chloroflexi bacterium]|nr:replicative DNA helicase [Chloroflexota bacterium]
MNGEKLPPHDNEAEEAVIGSLLIDPEAIVRVSAAVEADDFHQEKNHWVYEACLALYKRNASLDQITVADELERAGRLETTGRDYLSRVISQVPSSVYAEHYAAIVHRLAIMRRLINAGGEVARIGYEASLEVEAALNKADNILFRLRHGYTRGDFVHIKDVLDQISEQGVLSPGDEEAQASRRVKSGFTAVDDFLGWLEPSDLIILAARPSAGKTSFAMNIARNAAVQRKSRVAIFSLEMARVPLVQRLVSAEARVDTRKVRLGVDNEAEERRLLESTGILAECPIYIDDSPIIKVLEMRSKARRLNDEKGIDLIIVDYLQLIQGEGRVENRVQEVSQISRSLKALARELNVPLIAVSQLSRAVEWRSSHRPQLSDLRESGSIEQDADIVLFISREEMHYTEEEWAKEHPEEPYPRGLADVIVAKHRNGPTGEVKLRFISQFAKFDNLETADRRMPI